MVWGRNTSGLTEVVAVRSKRDWFESHCRDRSDIIWQMTGRGCRNEGERVVKNKYQFLSRTTELIRHHS